MRFVLIALLLIGGHSPVFGESAPPQEAYEWWADVLLRFVDDRGRTNFTALRDSRAELDRFTDWIAEISPKTHAEFFPTAEDALAFHINAYNALAMRGIIDEGIPNDFNSFFKRAAFFKFRKITVGGKRTNLYDYENKVIRPLGDPRVHFALNCMVRDCPRLPRKPFLGNELNEVLDALTREFFADHQKLSVDTEKQLVQVSAILDFYTRDFVDSGQAKDLSDYINRYVPSPVPTDYRVRFFDYDWTVNKQP